jgi:hypothetical protein
MHRRSSSWDSDHSLSRATFSSGCRSSLRSSLFILKTTHAARIQPEIEILPLRGLTQSPRAEPARSRLTRRHALAAEPKLVCSSDTQESEEIGIPTKTTEGHGHVAA